MYQNFQGFHPGNIVDDRYEIIDEIGRGGFGVVYRARQIAIDRIVALKILLPEADTIDPQAVERFRREAVLISSLESPNTITLIEFGQTQREQLLYTVMEFARGETLRNILAQEGKLPADRTVNIVKQVLSSLHEAHLRGIIHRDLKPANIMVGEFAGQKDHVKVLDFGIAKILKSGDTQSTLALTGRIVGTPRYMAPEQLRGANPTPASDLYALGLIMYEMLTGSPAVKVTEPMEQVEAQMRAESFKLPQLPGVPLDLVTSVNRVLEKDPQKRFQSALDLREALERSMSPRTAVPDPHATRLRAAVVPPPPAHEVPYAQATEEYEESSSLGAFVIIAVVLFMLALGGVAFLLLTSSGGSADDTPERSQQTQEQPPEQTQTPQQTPPLPPPQTQLPPPRSTDETLATTNPPGTDGQQTPGTDTQGSVPDTPDGPPQADGTPSQTDGSQPQTENDSETTSNHAPPPQPVVEEEEEVVQEQPPVVEQQQEQEQHEQAPPEQEQPEQQASASVVGVEVRAEPSNADVYVDGDRVCRSTPCTVQLPNDGSSHELRIRRRHYESYRGSISSSDAGGGISVDLEREPEQQQEQEEGPSPFVPL